MKFLFVMSCLSLLGGSLQAQNEAAQQEKKLTLVDLIVESDVVYQLTDFSLGNFPKSKTLAGDSDRMVKRFTLAYEMGQKKVDAIAKDLNEAKAKKKSSPGNLMLNFRSNFANQDTYFSLWNYSADFYQLKTQGALPDNTILFPKYDKLHDDLIWLCKNRYLLKLLKKGELTTEIYHFSPHELEFLVMVCTPEYLKGLHKYAESDKQREKLLILYQFLDFAPAKIKEFPLLSEVTVERLANAIDDQINDKLLFPDVKAAFGVVTKKMKEGDYLTQRDKRLIRSFFVKNENAQMMQNELALVMKEKILAQNDIQLLKTYLQRVENRQSIADVVNLAELVQSEAFLEGPAEFQEPIMRQFSLRKENEVVWILAPLLKHKDPELAERARIIMGRITRKNLGEEPAEWRAWYTEQNK